MDVKKSKKAATVLTVERSSAAETTSPTPIDLTSKDATQVDALLFLFHVQRKEGRKEEEEGEEKEEEEGASTGRQPTTLSRRKNVDADVKLFSSSDVGCCRPIDAPLRRTAKGQTPPKKKKKKEKRKKKKKDQSNSNGKKKNRKSKVRKSKKEKQTPPTRQSIIS